MAERLPDNDEDRRTGYYVASQDWPAIESGIPLEDLYSALEKITDEDVIAAGESLKQAGLSEDI